jgi:drug/metabolite transporter (DMT)-like permease
MKTKTYAYIALAIVCLAWGTTYLALRIVVVHFPSFLFLGIRQFAAGVLLGAILLISKKSQMPGWKNIGRQFIAGIFMITIGNGLVGWSEMYIPSGIAALICSLMPLWVIVINLFLYRDKKPGLFIYGGVLMGIAGMVLIFKHDISSLGQKGYFMGIILTIIAAISWASGSVYVGRNKHKQDPLMSAALQMFAGGIGMLLISPFADSYAHVLWTGEVIFWLVYLTIVGSLVAYAAYAYALVNLPITIVSLYAYINPLVAVILGWMVLHENLNIYTAAAFLCTLAGIFLVNTGYRREKAKLILQSNEAIINE